MLKLLLLFVTAFQAPRDTTLATFQLNPADTLTTNAAVVCQRGYAGSVRHVSGWVKHAVYVRDGRGPHGVEVDHRISLELGGSNAVTNLWAQPYPEAYSKDSVENWLHRQVCSGKLPLLTAQRWIARDWRAPYAVMKR